MRTIQEIFNAVIENVYYADQDMCRFMCNSLYSASFDNIITESEEDFAVEAIKSLIGNDTLADYISHCDFEKEVFHQTLQIYQNWGKRYELVERFRKENGYYD